MMFTEIYDLEMIPLGSQLLLTQESTSLELLTLLGRLFHDALPQSSEVLRAALVTETSWNESFVRLKEEGYPFAERTEFLQDGKNEAWENIAGEEGRAEWMDVVSNESEQGSGRLKVEKSLVMKTNEALHFWLLQTTTTCGSKTNMLLKMVYQCTYDLRSM